MSCYIISYDLNRPGQDYIALIDEIKALGAWCHCLESTWIVVSTLNEVQVRNRLSRQMDGNDLIFVGKLTGDAAWILTEECSDWLLQNLNN